MKTDVPFFLSYARSDAADVGRFQEVLNPLLAVSLNYNFRLWKDTAILAGEKWSTEIETALAECRFGILCVSPNFLASGYITRVELPKLLEKPLVVPVALHRVTFDGTMDLKGLAERQVFRDSRGRTFDACGRKNGRREFAIELMAQITGLLRKHRPDDAGDGGAPAA